MIPPATSTCSRCGRDIKQDVVYGVWIHDDTPQGAVCVRADGDVHAHEPTVEAPQRYRVRTAFNKWQVYELVDGEVHHVEWFTVERSMGRELPGAFNAAYEAAKEHADKLNKEA